MTYITETGRKSSTRLDEHETLQRLKDDKLLYGKAINDKQHLNNNIIDYYTVLKVESNMQKRRLCEEFKIRKKKKYLVNKMTNFGSQKLFQLIS